MTRWAACLWVVALLALTGCRSDILFVASYDRGDVWTDEVYKSFETAVRADRRVDAKVELYPMGLRKYWEPSWYRLLTDRALIRARNTSAEAIVCLGEPAIREVAEKLRARNKTFVVCGLQAHPSEYGFLQSGNVYGVWTPPDIEGAMKLVRKVKPSARRIAVLTDRGSTCWTVLLALEARKNWPLEVVAVQSVKTIDEWKAALSTFQHRADAILVAGMWDVTNRFGDPVGMIEVARVTGKTCRVPTVGLTQEAVTCGGILLAVAPSAEAVGRTAGDFASRILRRVEPTALRTHFAKVTETQVFVNVPLARKLGLKVPADLTLAPKPKPAAPVKKAKSAPKAKPTEKGKPDKKVAPGKRTKTAEKPKGSAPK